jgi:hypothetical protein
LQVLEGYAVRNGNAGMIIMHDTDYYDAASDTNRSETADYLLSLLMDPNAPMICTIGEGTPSTSVRSERQHQASAAQNFFGSLAVRFYAHDGHLEMTDSIKGVNGFRLPMRAVA